MKIYYKVVQPSLRSFHTLSVQYKLNEWVYAPSGKPFFVFDTLDNANLFTVGFHESIFKIYECVIEGFVETPANTILAREKWPQGTKFAYGVKLTKLVGQLEPFEYYSVVSTGGIYTNKVSPDGTVKFEKSGKNPESGFYSQSKDCVILSYENSKTNTFQFEVWHKSAWGNPVFSTRSKEKAESLAQLIKQKVINPRTQI